MIPTGHKSFRCIDRHRDAGEVSALQNSKALGLGTRPGAFILSGMMAVAYWQFHAPNGVSPVQNQGIPAVLYSTINEVAHQRYPPAFRMNAFSSAIFDLRLGSW